MNGTVDHLDDSDDELGDGTFTPFAESEDDVAALDLDKVLEKPKQQWRYEKSLACDVEGCDRRFNRQALLDEHRRAHAGIKPFACPYEGCDKAYPRRPHLQYHIDNAHEQKEKKYACDHPGCELRFGMPSHLNKHKLTHTKKPNRVEYPCTGYPPCKENFWKKHTLQAHINTAHLGLKAYPCLYVDSETGEPCTRGFSSASALTKHFREAHLGEKQEKPEKLHPCVYCSTPITEPVAFKTLEELEAHKAQFHPLICVECGNGKLFSSEFTLMNHIQTFHALPGSIEVLRCPHTHCGRTFNTVKTLQQHVRIVHPEKRKFVCGQFDFSTSKHLDLSTWDGGNACGYPFKTKNAIEGHVRTHHLGQPNRKAMRQLKKEEKRNVRPTLPKTAALSLLTGKGYEEDRERTCLVEGCEHRYVRTRDVAVHLATHHKLEEKEIEMMITGAEAEMAAEQEALEGGRFWIGGFEESIGTQRLDSIDPSVPPTPEMFAVPGHDQEPFLSGNGAFDPKFPSLGEPKVLDTVKEEEDDAMLDAAMGLSNIPMADARDGLY
ncbi:hypothetical protein EJ04DRAFT_507241 [Polyplosphaeria fusca]|uniref:C2H2-type domain-containing protein n=1 Tax=Polyplosphaeria fusca TaxID=682080 RepID=A0A9P4V7Y4_9PLEO|nr:hypothetical protein EJ04DRAFT_507241 [Polyplosphaeria fusca]